MNLIYLLRGGGFEATSEELWEGQRNEFGSQQWAHACAPGFQHTAAETLRGILSDIKIFTRLYICCCCEFDLIWLDIACAFAGSNDRE